MLRLRSAHRPVALAVAAAAGALLATGQPAPAALAHPLGNFTVNRYARLELSPQQLRVRYVIDLAEIPTFQTQQQIDVNSDGVISSTEGRAHAERQLDQVSQGVLLMVNGQRVPLRRSEASLELVAGQAGLSTTRIAGWLVPLAPVRLTTDAPAHLELRDENEPARVGWREIVVRAEELSVTGDSVPTREVSDELRTYPADLLTGPLGVRRISFDVTSTSVRPNPVDEPEPVAGHPLGASSGRAPDRIAALVTSVTLTPLVVLTSLLAAAAFGAGHALSPGHGKTIVGAYLVGSHGTSRHALFLGLTVTVVHTASVFALLLVTLFASRYVLPERVLPWLSLVSGSLVLAIGLAILRSRLAALRRSPSLHPPDHVPGTVYPDHHTHGEPHSHNLGARFHTHHVPPAGAPVTWRGLLALGVSGGLLPCPSAMVLGLGAIALDRTLYGLVLITAFSLGLAGTLVAIGLAVVLSSRLAGRLLTGSHVAAQTRVARVRRFAPIVPVCSAAVVSVAGFLLAADAAVQLGLAAVWSTPQAERALAAVSLSLAVAAIAAIAVIAARLGPTPHHASNHSHHTYVHPHHAHL